MCGDEIFPPGFALYFWMPRKLRFAPPGYYCHITQRGNYGQETFFSDSDRRLFLNLLGHHADARQVDVLAYCLMSNHFHLIARGTQDGGISRFMQGLNGQYAQLIHGRLSRRGRLWQERFYSCVLDGAHLRSALRYVELNPVRAGMAADACRYPWSSAVFHAGSATALATPRWLDMRTFDELYTVAEWRAYLAEGGSRVEHAAIRGATQRATPLGGPGFVERLEAEFHVVLGRPGGGRPRFKQGAAG